MPTALVSGITGQDGSFTAELLLRRGYDVYGIVRRTSSPNLGNIAAIVPQIRLLDADLSDQRSLDRAVEESRPDEVYNFAAQSFVGSSFAQPELTADITGVGAVRLLEAVRQHARNARFY